ncbi:MAG: DUF2156 domain-containing protein [Candidatus Omnitrophica bacterium]|nr:DUF2156 domain-containing protein [Candidatus Omnitrophota bacterium]
MNIEKLSLSHQTILQDKLKKSGSLLSEYSFANLYLFRGFHDYEVLTEDENIFIAGKTYDGKKFIMPAEGANARNFRPLLKALGERDFIFPIAEEMLGNFDPELFEIKYSENDSDYVYLTERLATYKGQKLHSKKNLLNQFLSLYSPMAKPLTKDLMDDARNILDEWQLDMNEPKTDTDYYPALEAFKLYDELVLCGGIYYVENEPAGFIIGEEIGEKAFALHFAKGKRKFKGMYQYMFNHFAGILPKKYELLNFEQDMGKLALKIAKSSYHPDMVLKKYRVCPK